MTHWLFHLPALLGILSTAVVFGTDMFFLTIGRAALRQVSPAAATEVMGFLHLYADARMPIWGVLAILSNLLLAVMSGDGHRWSYLASVLILILFVLVYARYANPENQIQIEAAQNGARLLTAANSRQCGTVCYSPVFRCCWCHSLSSALPCSSFPSGSRFNGDDKAGKKRTSGNGRGRGVRAKPFTPLILD
jgi:hypothetical protein